MGKKKGNKGDTEKVEEAPPPPPIIKETLIKLEFKLLNWKYMNFSQRFTEDTKIFTLKRILREKHGLIENLQLCFHSFSENNEVHDEMLTLRDCGLKGYPMTVSGPITDEEKELEEKSLPVVQLFYDFKPAGKADPVILFFR